MILLVGTYRDVNFTSFLFAFKSLVGRIPQSGFIAPLNIIKWSKTNATYPSNLQPSM